MSKMDEITVIMKVLHPTSCSHEPYFQQQPKSQTKKKENTKNKKIKNISVKYNQQNFIFLHIIWGKIRTVCACFITTSNWFLSKGSNCQDLPKWYPVTFLALTSKLDWSTYGFLSAYSWFLLKSKKCHEQSKHPVDVSWTHFLKSRI